MPRKIHQIWTGTSKVTDLRLKLQETLKEKNPGFEVYLWREENITADRFPISHAISWKIHEFEKTSPRSYDALLADFVRYEVLLNFGGIYFDFKTEGMKPLDPFLKYEIFFTDT